MPFTAQDVRALREKTNVGMMDCKKALAATDGDFEKAIEYLREKGLDPEVFRSGNCPGGDEYNARLIQKFSARVRSL